MKTFILIASLFFLANTGFAFTENQAITAILGEARGEFKNEPFENKYVAFVALAETIRNRNSLDGVYGYKNYNVNSDLKIMENQCREKFKNKKLNWCLELSKKNNAVMQKKLVDLAKKAWDNSRHTNFTKGAIGWGTVEDLKKFKKTKWWKNCIVTVKIGNHIFYKHKDK